MNNIIKSLILLLFISCGNKKETPTQENAAEVKTEAHHEEETPTMATLTSEQIKTVGIEYGKVELKQLTAVIKVNGHLAVPNQNKGNATSLYGGVIKSINVEVGSFVKKGQTIATITNPQFLQVQEEYLTVGNKITFSEQELQRQKELNAGNAGALKNLQSTTAELNTLRTRRAALQQQIQLMGINPSNVSNENLQSILVVKSPINGTISTIFSKIGSFVDVSSPVAEIVDNAQLHLDLNVFEKDLPLLKIGQIIHFTLTNNPVNEYDAQVFSIGTAFENESKTISVHAHVRGNKTGLIDGMNITGLVSLNNITAPAVANDAIVEADGKYYIFVVTDKEAEKGSVNFEKIEVVKGTSNVGFTAITPVQDLPKGAKIVTKGAFFINAKLTNTEE